MRAGKTIYLDHHATTPIDGRVMEAMAPYLQEGFGNPHSVDHAMGWAAAKAVERSATKVGLLIGADPDEIIFTSGATEANNLALLGVGRGALGRGRRRILCSAIEHKSVLAAGAALRKFWGYEVELIPVDKDGHVLFPALCDLLRDDVLLVSIMLVNNEIGVIQDIAKISDAVTSVGAMLHCDAAQAPCAVALRSMGRHVDLLSLSAHKMYGPKGIGALFVRRALRNRIEPMIYGGGQQYNLRSGTVPTALCVGMAEAVALIDGQDGERERDAVRLLCERLIDGMKRLPWRITVNGPVTGRHPGNANVCFEGFVAEDILGVLQPRLAASTGSACASGIPEPSHVLRAIGLSEEEARGSVRFGVGRNTSESDIDETVSLVRQALTKLSRVAPIGTN